MKVAILGSSGHWRLALEAAGLGASGLRDLEWMLAPVGAAGTEHAESMGPVLEAFTSLGQIARQFQNWQSMLERERPDIAVVNPPFFLLAPVIETCLRQGIHVFAEKPLALEMRDLIRLRKLAEVPGAPKLMAMLTMRYEPAFAVAQALLAEGLIGAPTRITVHKSYPLMGWDGQPRAAFYRRRATYGGTIPWIGSHAIDLIRWYSGSEFLQVSASHSTVGNSGHGELETVADLDFNLVSGASASAHLDFLRPYGSMPWGDDRLSIAGRAGSLEIRDGIILIQNGAGVETYSETDRWNGKLQTEPVTSMFRAFTDWVGAGKPMRLNTTDCFQAAEAALLARSAADQGQALAFC